MSSRCLSPQPHIQQVQRCLLGTSSHTTTHQALNPGTDQVSTQLAGTHRHAGCAKAPRPCFVSSLLESAQVMRHAGLRCLSVYCVATKVRVVLHLLSLLQTATLDRSLIIAESTMTTAAGTGAGAGAAIQRGTGNWTSAAAGRGMGQGAASWQLQVSSSRYTKGGHGLAVLKQSVSFLLVRADCVGGLLNFLGCHHCVAAAGAAT